MSRGSPVPLTRRLCNDRKATNHRPPLIEVCSARTASRRSAGNLLATASGPNDGCLTGMPNDRGDLPARQTATRQQELRGRTAWRTPRRNLADLCPAIVSPAVTDCVLQTYCGWERDWCTHQQPSSGSDACMGIGGRHAQ